jgi:sugar/nucleoside kinase (ribokinase family)
MNAPAQAIVAGHICLDIIPEFPGHAQNWYRPGSLLKMGPAVVATGGAVSNTGIALHRLGVTTRLMGKVGDDLIGNAILDFVRRQDPELATGMIVTPGEHSSYSVVLSPPGIDRMFLHCTGANDTFGAADVADQRVAGARLFHFGYPTLMRAIYSDGGHGLEQIFTRVRRQGLTTTLDMSQPDPNSEAGQVNWPAFLERVLPVTDVYLPSFDETLLMIDRPRFGTAPDAALLASTAQRLLDWGAKIVVLKLGDQGAYLRTSRTLTGLGLGAPPDLAAWTNRELLAPCFQVQVVGTNGSGDCTIAGFLAGLLRGLSPEQTLTAAVAVGACNVEAADATSGVRPWEETQQRLAAGWPQRPINLHLPGWHHDAKSRLWVGPNDRT